MHLTPYVETLQQELVTVAQAGDQSSREVVERLVGPLDAATRLVLLEALADAAAEITSDLAPGSVEVRLRGRDPEFAVRLEPQLPQDEIEPVDPPPELAVDEASTRTTLRLPASLKARIDQAAAAEGISANAWLVRLATRTLAPQPEPSRSVTSYGSQQYTGWVQ